MPSPKHVLIGAVVATIVAVGSPALAAPGGPVLTPLGSSGCCLAVS